MKNRKIRMENRIEINEEFLSNKNEIPIGQRVKDLVSGIIGYSITRCIFLNGCIQHEIQPDLEEEEMQKTVWIDENQIEMLTYLDTKEPILLNDKIQRTTMGNSIKLGYLFKDIITDLEGITIAYAKHYSGLQEYEIQPIIEGGDSKIRQPIWIPKNRLVEVKEEVIIDSIDATSSPNNGRRRSSGGGHRNHP